MKISNHKCKFRECGECNQIVKITSSHKCQFAFHCSKCDFTTSNKLAMIEHRKSGHMFECPDCSFKSHVRRVMKRHYLRAHKLSDKFTCSYCSMIFSHSQHLSNHILTTHAASELPHTQSAFRKSCTVYGSKFEPYKYASIDTLFDKFSPQLLSILRYGASSYKHFKSNVVIFAILDKYDYSTNTLISRNEFIHQSRGNTFTYLTGVNELEDYLTAIEAEAEERFDSYCDLEGSGWSFQYVSGLFIQLGACEPLTGGCQLDADMTSDFLWDGPCEDGECFYTAVSRHFHERGESTGEEILAYAKKHFKECRTREPVSIAAIKKFERKYKLNINVILKEGADLFVIHRAKNTDDTINLLMVPIDDIRHHYVYISNVDGLVNELRFLSYKYAEHGAISSRKQVYTCLNCLNVFNTRSLLDKHSLLCNIHEAQKIEMPQSGETIKFSRFEATHRAPLIGAFDFETKMVKENLRSTPSSKDISTHKVVSYSLMITSGEDIIFERTESDETNCLQLFIEAVFDSQRQIEAIMERTTPMTLTQIEEDQYEEATTCHICRGELLDDSKVRDHCHFTGSFIGAAHNFCNLKRRRKYSVPIYAHNFSSYDSHFLLQAISEYKDVVPNLKAMCFNTQRFRSIAFGIFNFLDSMQFISESLDSISQQLARSDWKYKILENSNIFSTERQKQLLLKKGIFPYELLTSLREFEKMREFPPKSSFYSTIREENITDDDYEHGKEVFKAFKLRNMGEYLRLYNRLDVILLLEALESFRSVGIREFGLDPAYFISLPQYGFQW